MMKTRVTSTRSMVCSNMSNDQSFEVQWTSRPGNRCFPSWSFGWTFARGDHDLRGNLSSLNQLPWGPGDGTDTHRTWRFQPEAAPDVAAPSQHSSTTAHNRPRATAPGTGGVPSTSARSDRERGRRTGPESGPEMWTGISQTWW